MEISNELMSEFRSSIGEEISKTLTDSDCMRFLRARNGNIAKASTMATGWYEWWHTALSGKNPDNLTPATILTPINDTWESVMTEYCPHCFEGFDRMGRPIYWEQTGLIANNLGKLAEVMTLDDLLNCHIRAQELMNVRRQFKSQQLGTEIEKSILVLDLKGLPMSPSFFGINYVQKMFQIDEKYYPERLAHLFIINAPWFFSAIYALITPFIDSVTASKIRIIGSNYIEELRAIIDDDQIPVEMGGAKTGIVWNWPYTEETGISPDQIRQYLERHHEKEFKVHPSDDSTDNLCK